MVAPGNRAVREVRDAEVQHWERLGYRLAPDQQDDEPAPKKKAAKKSAKKSTK
jgi:hypothetical protein